VTKYTVECVSFIRLIWSYPPQYLPSLEKEEMFADSAIDAIRKASKIHPNCFRFYVIVGDSKGDAE